MYDDTMYKTYRITEEGKELGTIKANINILNNDFLKPFIREYSPKYIIKIGTKDYETINTYIINSMKDYYQKLLNANPNELDNMNKNYQHLYKMWEELHTYKKNKDFVNMDKTYDMISYELYLLGYMN